MINYFLKRQLSYITFKIILYIYNCNNYLIITIVNFEAIILRIKTILRHYDLTSSTFADMIEVQRSSISHLLSGRNKPSLDFVLKVVAKFPEVDLYWFLYGTGSFPKEKEKKIVVEKKVTTTPSLFQNASLGDISEKNKIISEYEQETQTSKSIKKIVILYTDGTFEDYSK